MIKRFLLRFAPYEGWYDSIDGDQFDTDDDQTLVSAADYDALQAARDEAIERCKDAEADRAELAEALRGIATDYPCVGRKNIHTGACTGCPVCDAKDVLIEAPL